MLKEYRFFIFDRLKRKNKMDLYGRSFIKSEKFSFTQHIENFFIYLRQGVYISPTYYSPSCECELILVMKVYGDEITFDLRRINYTITCQYVDVTFSIEDSFELRSIKASKGIYFTPDVYEDVVLRVKQKDLFFGYCLLNTLRFIPNDTLCVKCEITTYTSFDQTHESKINFERDVKNWNNILTKSSLNWWLSSFCLAMFVTVLMWGIFRIWSSSVVPLLEHVCRTLPYSEFLYYTSCSCIFFFLLLYISVPIKIVAAVLWYTTHQNDSRPYLNRSYNCRQTLEENCNNIVNYRAREV